MKRFLFMTVVTFAGVSAFADEPSGSSTNAFTNFEAITNGMTRGEVEKRLSFDGGLRSASPVRFIDPACPGFKIDVEFSFKRDAADGNRAIESPNDPVIHVSKPYRQPQFLD